MLEDCDNLLTLPINVVRHSLLEMAESLVIFAQGVVVL
jgi:hypothetical protein